MKAVIAIALAACSTQASPLDHQKPAAKAPPPEPTTKAPDKPVAKPLPPMPSLAGVAPVEADLVLRDFAFADGEHIAELRVHYTTYGTLQRDAAGHATNAILIMHGTTGSGAQFTRKQFVDELFNPGQTLDLTKFFVILPDDIGHGKSSKPSDGLHAKFPHYGYRDMVTAEHAIVESLKVDHLRVVMGTSMGCMHSWMWAEQWPTMMDAVMPLACAPTQIAGRNRQWRRMAIDAITKDPAWHDGEYTTQPTMGLRGVAEVFLIAGSSPIADHKRMPTRDAADKATDDGLDKFIAGADANDMLYAIASSSDYDPSADLEKISARVTFINSADDFINPPELGIAEQLIKRVSHGKFILIPASEDTHGHGTHTWAKFYKDELAKLLTN